MLNQTISPPIAPDRCVLRHKLFAVVGEPVFRRAETGGAPALAMRLDDRDVLVPLDRLQREFGITPDSQDGRMLAMVAGALDFMSVVRIGDRLPDEVLISNASRGNANGSEADWEPDPVHVTAAAARLRMQLIGWLSDAAGRATARLLGPDDPARLPGVVADLAREQACIEALRDHLLRPISRMAEKINRLQAAWSNGAGRVDAGRFDTLAQVNRLVAIAIRQVADKFDDLDARSADIMTALRDADGHRARMRSDRDWLHRSQRTWQNLLSDWDAIEPTSDDGLPSLLNRTYQFLAPRFMPVTKWQGADRTRSDAAKREARMVW